MSKECAICSWERPQLIVPVPHYLSTDRFGGESVASAFLIMLGILFWFGKITTCAFTCSGSFGVF